MTARPPRLLWAPYAQRGSIYPVAPVIERLAWLGVRTLLLGPPNLEPIAASLASDFQPYESDISYDWSRPDGRDQHFLGPRIGATWFHKQVAAEYAEVDRVLTKWVPDVIFADSFVVGAGLAAEASGVPWASYVHYLFDEGAQVDAMHRIWWESSRHPELDAYMAWWDSLRQAIGLGPETRPWQDAPWYRMSPLGTFLLGHPGLRRGSRPLPSYVSRTLLPPWDEPDEAPLPWYRQASNTHRRRVLVANSSAWQDDIHLVRAALAGLADTETDVIATVSAEHALNVDPPPNAAICGYAPHSRLLPTVDVVVSTSGYGLVSKALWHGRPLVVAPFARDQHYVAEAVKKAGCGVSVGWPPDSADLRGAVETVLKSTDIRRRARKMSGAVPGYPGPAKVAEMILGLGSRR